MDKYWIKRNWKNIALIVVAFLWMTQCTKTCTSRSVVKTDEVLIDSLRTVCEEQAKVIDAKTSDIEWMNRNKEDLKGVSNANQKALMDKITSLNEKNAVLEKENKALKKENDRLNKEIKEINNQPSND